jgi:Phosphotransferase enzyme family
MSIRQPLLVTRSDTRPAPEVLERMKALFGTDAAIAACRGGRNSRVYRIERAREVYALKIYPSDGRRRVEREYGAVSFFNDAGLRCVAKPVAAYPEHDFAVYSWLDGEPVGETSATDVDGLISFAAQLHSLRDRALPCNFEEAVEACCDERAVVRQIDTRLARLRAVGGEPALDEYLSGAFLPVFERDRAARSRGRATRLRRRHRTLSPSDFGFHNALREASGGLAFLDFEYFGWDDPIKLVCDVCWHPGMDLPRDLRDRFLARSAGVYAQDTAFEERLRAAYPLYGLRWCLIVLNEFIPELWERRVAAGLDRPAGTVKQVQLGKAYRLLERVVAGLDGNAL